VADKNPKAEDKLNQLEDKNYLEHMILAFTIYI
jgi:hypothetical protein